MFEIQKIEESRGGGEKTKETCDEEGEILSTPSEVIEFLRQNVPPNLFEKLAGASQNEKDGFAIDPNLYQLSAKRIGEGSESTVYKLISLDPARPTLVIKIDNKEGDIASLAEHARIIRSEYETIREWYKELPHFIPEELQFIGHSPTNRRVAILTIREHLGTAGEIRDLFRGIAKEELIALLREDEKLRTDFLLFARLTLERAESADEMIDTLGDKNIVIADELSGKSLRFLDPHGVKHPKTDPNDADRLEADLQYLHAVMVSLEG